MKDNDEDGFSIDKDDFKDVLEKFKKKKTKAYDFLLKANEDFQDAIYNLCKLFIDAEEFPLKFKLTVLHMTSKKKGSVEMLNNNRFLHMKNYLARLCESLLVGQMKTQIFKQSTKYQIGGQAGHSIDEHLFSLKSLIRLMELRGEGLYLTLVDIISFFDQEDILDGMETLDKMNINKKACRLWYKMNDETVIKIQTAMGMSNTAEVGAVLGQGSTGAAVISQAMIDKGLKDYFAGSDNEMYYGKVRVESAAYQDDISKPSADTISAQVGMTRLEDMLSQRGLRAHRDKTGYILFGNPNPRMKKELEIMPLKFGEFEVKQKEQDKYLGQILHQEGLTKSVEATIKERSRKIKGAIYLTKQVVETIEMQTMGSLMAAKQLWEQAIVPSLLSGAGTWVDISPESEALCEDLQEEFWRVMMQVSKSSPKVMLTAETSSIRMKERIWQMKLLTARNIMRNKESLAYQIYREQVDMS